MQARDPARNFLTLLLAISVAVTSAPVAQATEAWENGRAYTKMLQNYAAEAAAVAAAAATVVTLAVADVAAAQARFNAANTAATSAAALVALAQADAALATAVGIAAAAKSAALAAAAVVAGATIGTYISQGLRGIWDFCWDPLCDATALSPGAGAIFVPFSQAEAEALLPTMTSLATDGELSLSQSDFDEAGIPTEYATLGMRLFVGATRGAAAGTAGRWAEVLFAVENLQLGLVEYRAAMENYADVLDATAYVDQVAQFNTEVDKFNTYAEIANAACDIYVDDCPAMAAELAAAKANLSSAKASLATIDWATLAASPLFPPITLAEFQQFLTDTGTLGAAALPPEEIAVADALLAVADAYYPGQPSMGPMIAAYDAQGDTNGHESALFDPVTGELTLSELLRDSATILSDEGPWLNIDLSESPLTAEAEENISGVPAFSVPSRIILLVVLIGGAWLGMAYRRNRRGVPAD